MSKRNWRLYLIIFLVLGSFYVVSPSIFNLDKAPYWVEKILPEKKLKLGLDLKGGIHLVMGVNVEKVLKESVDRDSESIKEALKDEKINANINVKDKKVYIKYIDLKNENKILELVSKRSYLKPISFLSKEIVFSYNDETKEIIKKRALDQTIEAIRNRIDEFGVNEPSINAQGSDRILIQLPGVKNPERAKSIIGRTARLEFKIVIEDYDITKLQALVLKAKNNGIEFKEKVSYEKYLKDFNKFVKGKIPKNTVVLFNKKIDLNDPSKRILTPYLLESKTLITGDYLDSAYVTTNQFNEPLVSFALNPVGAKYMEELTGKNQGKRLAIVLDKNVYSAPVIQSTISSRGQITLGRGRSMSEMFKEAEDIALVLRAGSLPAELVFEEERTVGPTLGGDSIKKGRFSMVLGSIIVILFMLIYYRLAGLIADIALFLNILLITSILVLFEATLTLPGIAGIVLTVGMSVDANIIIFERIREEIRLGNSSKASIESGYSKALWTILDANITTAIAAIVLLQYGSGPIKGFAVTLLIGIFSSVFSAVYASKWMFKSIYKDTKNEKVSI
jgi:preprotein translocase subunit SecD